MIRRIVLVAAAAVALILIPSAAMAYEAPGVSSTVSDSTPAIGASTTLTVQGGMANANQMLKLVITGPGGTQSFNERANASGAATFTFTLNAAGKYTAEVTNAAGDLLSTQELTVGTAGEIANNGDVANSGDQLKDTGFDGMGLAVGGGALVLAGAGAVVVARRRRSVSA